MLNLLMDPQRLSELTFALFYQSVDANDALQDDTTDARGGRILTNNLLVPTYVESVDSICEMLLIDAAVLRGLTGGIQLLFLLYKINQHDIAAESVAECEKVLIPMQCF